ncbi:EthD family reductase [Novosphingobium sp. Fuku2-ISO-50]|uniref:EthD family reductase n=1 Tax=Novosphingobium sp. Fuku2-ISO-50 TaxID=1739114 RepID=UPI00076C89CC|nr:EthD family reductase [Novosphingobium sp. Fuku2-ISO-50]KUR78331.1 ethyl tert-butyl ether degradation protein EthD [Novosphingobium sp. Fuku2-ISO-50]
MSDATGAVVVTVLYNEPSDPAAFEAYYEQTHMPLVGKVKGIDRAVLIKGLPGPDGSKPAYYRVAQLFFTDAAAMAASLGSPEGQATTADIANFADGGVTVLVGAVG